MKMLCPLTCMLPVIAACGVLTGLSKDYTYDLDAGSQTDAARDAPISDTGPADAAVCKPATLAADQLAAVCAKCLAIQCCDVFNACVQAPGCIATVSCVQAQCKIADTTCIAKQCPNAKAPPTNACASKQCATECFR
jgi:hypothetical protein